jgi:hypothetical protein
MIMDYGIYNDNIYNFDKTSFTIGIIATTRVITLSKNMGKPVVL